MGDQFNASIFGPGCDPYGWHVDGVTSVEAVNVGSSITVNFTGTSLKAHVTVAGIGSGSSVSIGAILDGAPITPVQLTSATSSPVTVASSLSDTSHTLVLFLTDAGGAADRWAGEMSLIITSLEVDTGKSVSVPSLPAYRALFYGDSTMEGYTGSGWIGFNSIPRVICNSLSAQCSIAAFSGQTWSTTVSGIPGVATAYAFVRNGEARSFSVAPDWVINNMGHNGTVTVGAVQTWMESIRSDCGAGTAIVVIIPFSQNNASTITTGFDNYVSANPTDTHVELIDLGAAAQTILANPTYSADGIHPNEAGAEALGDLIIPLMPPSDAPTKPGNPSTTAMAGLF